MKNLQCIETLLSIIDHHGNYLDTAWHLIMTAVQVNYTYHSYMYMYLRYVLCPICSLFQHVVEVFGLLPLSSGGFKQSGLSENSSLVSTVTNTYLSCTSILCIFVIYRHWLMLIRKKSCLKFQRSLPTYSKAASEYSSVLDISYLY